MLLIRKKGYNLRDLNSVDFEIQIPHYLGGERKEEEEKMQHRLAKRWPLRSPVAVSFLYIKANFEVADFGEIMKQLFWKVIMISCVLQPTLSYHHQEPQNRTRPFPSLKHTPTTTTKYASWHDKLTNLTKCSVFTKINVVKVLSIYVLKT